ncbi:TRM11 family SAM-dependent methyltransferase [Catellatospora coxensis]|uniref:TRM11 family SAM-dependent methyltransferase n=1 Tax=Catellatospora coxensis TaxID=310354 RepID=UPI0019441BA8|nr:SAM-dependent methyltransferase [Catellatospora coxensis]
MARYGLLVAPSANRVYTQSAPDLMAAELAVFSERALGGRIEPAEVVEFAGRPYLTFEVEDGALTVDELRVLANLSSAYALFEMVEGGLLRPLGEPSLDRYDDDLITIQKYAGKTNEHFTKLLLNVTVLATSWAEQLLTKRFTVLDPVAGRGTTLNQALMYGWDAIGIELDGKDVEAYSAFLKTWLKNKRIKHTTDMTPLRREGKRLGRRFDARIGDARDNPQHLSLFEADTIQSRALLKGNSVDVIAADLPYGVVHGSRSAKGLARGPQELLEEALPGWSSLLRPGGALGISWNTHVAPREDALDLLEEHGLEAVDYEGFEHRVDQAITRDILVARKV